MLNMGNHSKKATLDANSLEQGLRKVSIWTFKPIRSSNCRARDRAKFLFELGSLFA
jgi:hypothetical protein